jgi:mono/diheme cytochrome c family protein
MTDGRQRRSFRLAISVAAAFLCVLVPARPALAQTMHEVSLPDNPLQGRVLFANRQCHQCHGFADGRPGIGPSLGDEHFEGTFLELGAALWNHVPGMSVTFDVTGVPWPRLSDAETIELLVFMNFIDYLGRPGESEAGEEIFERNGCHTCHSVGGGEAHLAPDLAELGYFASPLYVAQQIWNHGPSMLESMREMNMRPPSFEDGDFADISAYVRQRTAPGPRERMLSAPGNPNRGAELFVSKGCSICHGKDGRGGPSGPNLGERDLHRSAEGIAGAMWNHALTMNETMRALGIGWPEFQNSEMADLVSFLFFLPFDDPVGDSERGAEVFRLHACVECHGETGSGGESPSLDGSDVVSAPSSLVAAMWNHAPTMKTAILGEGRRWPQLTGQDLRDLLAFFADGATTEQ